MNVADRRGYVDVLPLLAQERTSLLELLEGLRDEEWAAATPCPAWSVHALTVHVVHDDIRLLSGGRDRHMTAWVPAESLDELIVGLDEANDAWVRSVAPVMSPRVATQLLASLAAPYEAYLRSLIPQAVEAQVSWAGSEPQPNWLDVAREFTERWVHQQQVRQAVARPGCDGPVFVTAVVETFMRGVPNVLPARRAGTRLEVIVDGIGRRVFVRESDRWTFSPLRPDAPCDAVIQIPADTFWRRAVRMLPKEDALATADFSGDLELASAVLHVRGAIVADDSQP